MVNQPAHNPSTFSEDRSKTIHQDFDWCPQCGTLTRRWNAETDFGKVLRPSIVDRAKAVIDLLAKAGADGESLRSLRLVMELNELAKSLPKTEPARAGAPTAREIANLWDERMR